MIARLLTAAVVATVLVVPAPAVAAPAPEHAAYCSAGYLGSADGTPTAYARCQHLHGGYWMYVHALCKKKWSTATYATYSSRTYLAWSNRYVSCQFGYYMASYGYRTGVG